MDLARLDPRIGEDNVTPDDIDSCNSTHLSGTGTGNWAECSFTGTGAEVYGWRGPKGGALRALVDGTVHGDAISQERTTATYNVLLARIGGLNHGKHTVRIETDPSTAADVVTGVDYLRIYTAYDTSRPRPGP